MVWRTKTSALRSTASFQLSITVPALVPVLVSVLVSVSAPRRPDALVLRGPRINPAPGRRAGGTR